MDPKSRLEKERLEGKQKRIIEMVEAADRVFARKGLEKTTMQDIADEASIGIATLFRYFPKKDRIIVAVAAKSLESNLVVFQEVLDKPGTCYEKIEHLFDTFIAFNEQKESRIKFIESFETYVAQSTEPFEGMEVYNAASKQLVDIYYKIIETGKTDGSIRTDIPITDTLSTLSNVFGIFAKKLSLHRSILMLESKVPSETQLLILKNIFLSYIKND
ncbi:TetR/AcrR family transcriptional regulator [Viridibacillus sp. FSL H8-0123]|uniref:TetR/AcrR family transcriptional regulator n=1 Tax=Viridibacillus sp. FSL H8-0123 TaxID=1928922 RepID=UPI00096CEA0E|nr:TetR/AcrR family transcriptional regulator [Viridibacillus sp. FSL H8-0123]OMC79965.1 TetR family transcriptional regulator [Viridibacillus sp. FSL H8-0123]